MAAIVIGPRVITFSDYPGHRHTDLIKVPGVADRPTGELGGIDLTINCFATHLPGQRIELLTY